MLKFKDVNIHEDKNNKNIFMDYNGELWFGYDVGSGQTFRIDMRSYITDKKDDKNYNQSLVDNLVRYSKNKLRSKGDQSLYSFPYYTSKNQKNYDIYGGNEGPSKLYYYVISKQKYTVINFFSSKKEAEMWIKTTM